jgi:hypothetical protein
MYYYLIDHFPKERRQLIFGHFQFGRGLEKVDEFLSLKQSV